MSAEVHDDGACEVSLNEARTELERLLADNRFRVSERQRGILSYLAERRFKGCAQSVKAYSIALDVLGRSSDFDASTDPIVRIEISRLRTALDTYYSVFGAATQASVHIPKGSYVALFPKTPIPHDPVEDHHNNLLVGFDGAVGAPFEAASGMRHRRLGMTAALGLSAAVAVAAVIWWTADQPMMTAKPTVVVAMSAVSDDMEGEAGLTKDTLITALSQFQTIVVSRSRTVLPKGGASRSYEIDLKYYADGDDRSVWWQMVDSKSGSLLKSGIQKIAIEGKAPASVREEMAGALARQVASSRGVINSIEMQEAPKGAPGNVCVLRAEYALDEGDADDILGATRCLDRTLALAPDDPDAISLFARLKVTVDDGEAGAVLKAVDLAKRAVSITPLSDRAQTALMMAQFAAGHTQAAIEAGNRSIALNPNSAGAAASLGLVLFSSGFWKAGADLAQEAAAMSDSTPRDATLVLALDAYRSGRWSEASLLAEQVNGSDLVTRSLRAAALGELGAADAKGRFLEAKAGTKDFEQLFRQKMMALRMRPEIVRGLETGLSKAGANFDTVASVAGP
jgi:hypothetical protein